MTIELDGASLQEGAMDGLTLLEVYVGAEKIWPTSEVYEVSLTEVLGSGTAHPMVTVTVPAGQTWSVRVQGTMTKADSLTNNRPHVRIGDVDFGPYGRGAAVDCSGTVTSANSTIALVTRSGSSSRSASFTGTVTIEK